MKDDVCKNCHYWQDFDNRVEACISDATSNRERNELELRPCGYSPPPTVRSRVYIYTDGDYHCSSFKETVGK